MSTYHHGDLRQALIAAGLEALSESGPEQLGLRELARRVGVSPAAPYRHFPDRQALLGAVATEGFRQFAADLAAARDAVVEAGWLVAMARAYVRFALARPHLFRLMFSAAPERGTDPALHDAGEAAYALLATSAAREDPDAPAEAAIACWAFVHGLATLLLDRQLAGAADAGVDELVTRLTSRFISGLRASRAH